MAATTKIWANNSPPSCEDDDLNGFKNENNNLILGSGQLLDTGDNQQTNKAVAVYAGGGDYYADSGATNTYVLSPTGSRTSPPAYFEGMRVRWVAANLNTGACTINVNSLGAVALQMEDGSALTGGEMVVGKKYEATYQGGAFNLTGVFDITAQLNTVTVAELKLIEDLKIGGRFIVSDRGNGIFETKTGLTANELDIIVSTFNAARQFQLVTSPAKGIHIGLTPSGVDQSDKLLRLATLNTGSAELEPGSYVFNSYDFDGDEFICQGEVTTNNPSVKVTNIHLGKRAEFNWSATMDSDRSSPLTLGLDEDLGKLSRVDYRLPDTTIDDGNTTDTFTIDNMIPIRRFRLRGTVTGSNMPLTIRVQTQEFRDTGVAVVLSTGQIATPMSNFVSGAQNFVEITKGTGTGVVAFKYQFQNPKTKVRSSVPIWQIDLDDGKTPYFYRFLLPECSLRTMNGAYRVANTTNLNWIVEAITGPVSIISSGQNLGTSSAVRHYLKTVVPADYVDGQFYTDYFEATNIDKIEVIMTQSTGGNSTTWTDVKLEVIY